MVIEKEGSVLLILQALIYESMIGLRLYKVVKLLFPSTLPLPLFWQTDSHKEPKETSSKVPGTFSQEKLD